MSYTFNGATHKLVNTATPIAANTSFTLVSWVKVADATPATSAVSICVGTADTSTDQARVLLDATGGATISVTDGTASQALTTTNKAVNNTWFLMAGLCTVNGSNQITDITAWSYNGTAEATPVSVGSLTKTMSPALGDTIIGARWSGSGTISGQIVGDVAHCAIFNKVLSGAELTDLTTNAPNVCSAAANLVVYWPLLTGPEAHASYGGASYDLTVTDASLNSGVGPTINTGASAAINPATRRSLISLSGGMQSLG